jgi:hypothetical protein
MNEFLDPGEKDGALKDYNRKLREEVENREPKRPSSNSPNPDTSSHSDSESTPLPPTEEYSTSSPPSADYNIRDDHAERELSNESEFNQDEIPKESYIEKRDRERMEKQVELYAKLDFDNNDDNGLSSTSEIPTDAPSSKENSFESRTTKTQPLAGAAPGQDPEITDSKNSLNSDLKDDHEDSSPSKPSPHLSAWRDYFESEFSRTINDEAAKIIADAVGAAANRRGSLNNLITVNTKEFVSPLTAPHAPLEHLQLDKRPELGQEQERPAWYESQLYPEKMSYEALEAFGSTRPSVEFASILETAASLTDTTPNFHELTPWHLAFVLLSSGATGINWQLEAQNSSLRSAAAVLRRNLRNHEPSLESLFPWSELDLTDDSEMEDLSEETDSNHNAKVWSRAFDKIRNPKDFKWSISCGQILDKLWHSHGIAASFARQGDQRAKNFNPRFTPRSLFIQSLIHGLQKNKTEQDLLARIAKTIGKDEEALRKDLQTELHRGSDRTNESNPVATQRLLAVINQAKAVRDDVGNDGYVSTRHLIAALLLPFEGSPTGALVIGGEEAAQADRIVDEFATFVPSPAASSNEELPSNWDKWISRLRKGLHDSGTKDGGRDETKESATGGKHHTSRNPHPDELCLDIDHIANACARLLKNASGESDFVFGLFGPWGRGKTTLADKIQSEIVKMRNPEEQGYVCIRFCAWKYPTRPEIWVHLYEEVLKRAKLDLRKTEERAHLSTPDRSSSLQRNRISFRVGILNQGWTPLLLGSVLLLISRLPWLDFSISVARAIDFSGAFLLILFALRSTQLFKSLRLNYGTLPNHREKLGLQSIIGQDLSNLLRVWITPKPEPATECATKLESPPQPKPLISWSSLWIAAGAVVIACLLSAGKIVDHGIKAIDAESSSIATGGSSIILKKLSEKLGDTLAFPVEKLVSTVNYMNLDPLATSLIIGFLLILLGFAGCVFSILIRIKPKSYDKLLLVVDDLDRCEPDQMLAVVESLRVFLDKTEMSKRLQILMLIDDRKLDQAILKRARERGWMPKSREERRTYCREQREKYFVTSIRLGQLDDDDIADVTTKILDREANESKSTRAQELEKRQVANKQAMERDENDVSRTRVVKPARTRAHGATPGPNSSKTEETEVEPEETRSATEAEVEEERERIRAEKARARAEEEERQRLNDELQRQKLAIEAIEIDEKTTFSAIERQLLHRWVKEQADGHTSPRTIRAMITRYLLARLMISNFGIKPDAKILLAALSSDQLPADLGDEERRAYQRVGAAFQEPND